MAGAEVEGTAEEDSTIEVDLEEAVADADLAMAIAIGDFSNVQ